MVKMKLPSLQWGPKTISGFSERGWTLEEIQPCNVERAKPLKKGPAYV
jgi:hypothetical protein